MLTVVHIPSYTSHITPAGDPSTLHTMIRGLQQLVITTLTLLTCVSNAAPTYPTKRGDDLKFDFGNTKIRGVNAGGWFVLEPWITPSIFEATPDNVIDEYTYCETLGKDEAEARLQQHWKSWFTEDDFALMAEYGLNLVRIPIGYWSILPIDGDPYVQGAYEYLGQALDWAHNHGLNVMIDLHGAQGSQNGFDNSGRRGGISWLQGDSLTHTKNVLNKIRDDHAGHPAVIAVELINEPFGPSLDMGVVRQFYMDGWGNLESSHVAIAIHDAFVGVNSWNDFGSGMWALLLDTHHYEVFDNGALQMGIQDHISTACSFGASMAANNKWTFAGEWTGGYTDCAKWLNGRGIGARYDGTYYANGQTSSHIGSCDGKFTGTVADLGLADHNNIKSFIQAQITGFEKAAGWVFWTWHTESAPGKQCPG